LILCTTIYLIADNRSKRKRQARSKVPDFTLFAEKKESQRIHITPQLTLAMFQYLSTCKYSTIIYKQEDYRNKYYIKSITYNLESNNHS
jgi:hypothetical protein